MVAQMVRFLLMRRMPGRTRAFLIHLKQLIPLVFWVTTHVTVGASYAQALANLACDNAAQYAALKTGVPLSVLRTITRAETGRSAAGRLVPWPWTVNTEGKGYWFESKKAGTAYAQAEVLRGARSFDVGCFQVNYRWHGDGFVSIENMFDPIENALYAARFLRELHTELGDWYKAAGAYPSRLPKFANEYRIRLVQIHADLDADPILLQSRPVGALISKHSTSENNFPFLQVSGLGMRNGSLVPVPATKGPQIRLSHMVFIGP